MSLGNLSDQINRRYQLLYGREFNAEDYLSANPDVNDWYTDGSQAGIHSGEGGLVNENYGVSTKGWEDNWVKALNQAYGTQYTDMSQFSREQYAQHHYAEHGMNEGRRSFLPAQQTEPTPVETPTPTPTPTPEPESYVQELESKMDTITNQVSTNEETYKQELLDQSTALKDVIQSQDDAHKTALDALTVKYDALTGQNSLLQEKLDSNTTTTNTYIDNLREMQTKFDDRYTKQGADLTAAFTQRYANQNQAYASNLFNLREELTGNFNSQAGILNNTILNMQNAFNNKYAAQEQKYSDTLKGMTNTHTEQQRQLRDTLNAQANPHTRQTQVGVQAPNAQGQAQAAMLQARGTKGSFNRQGLRIQGLNI